MREIAAALTSSLQRVFRRSPDQSEPRSIWRDVRTIWGDPALVMTPAQRLARYARSPLWRCISCGKLHAFDDSVAVVFASPCSCGNFEFESPFTALLRRIEN